MSIRPVDLQVIIPRATDVSKIQHASDQQLISQQQQFAEHWQHISAQRKQKIQSTSRAEGGKVNRDREKKNQNKNLNQENQFGEDFTEKKPDEARNSKLLDQAADPLRGHLIDIKT